MSDPHDASRDFGEDSCDRCMSFRHLSLNAESVVALLDERLDRLGEICNASAQSEAAGVGTRDSEGFWAFRS
jgi:hypothetical protein